MDGFGKRLVEAREKKGLSQKRLAELLDITPTRLNYWEKDKREPDFFMFTKIIIALEADANQLLGLKYYDSIISDEYSQLNLIGRQKVDDYIKDLSGHSKYITKPKSTDISDFDNAVDVTEARQANKQHKN